MVATAEKDGKVARIRGWVIRVLLALNNFYGLDWMSSLLSITIIFFLVMVVL